MNALLRKYLFFYIICIFPFQDFFSQNLVLNPSFEDYYQCPTAPNQLSFAIDWSASLNNDAEYFNRCSIDTILGVPYQGVYNYQEANFGNGFVGALFYNSPGLSYREYIQGTLSSTLAANKSYNVKFWINRASATFGGKYAINNIALSFQSGFTDTSANNSYVLNYPMHIFNFSNPIISDTAKWVKIEGVYRANGTEDFIVIGNFKSDNQTDTIDVLDGTYPAAYYFIDDVSVEEITEPFWQYRDTTINYGDSVLIGPALTGLDIDWYTANDEFIANAPGIYVKPETSRNYIAKETFNGVETTHLVHVTVLGGVGLLENELEHVAVYPNPSSGEFSLGGLFSGKTELKIVNLAGQTVWLERLNFDKTTEKISLALEKGVYVLELTHEETGQSVKRKIVID